MSIHTKEEKILLQMKQEQDEISAQKRNQQTALCAFFLKKKYRVEPIHHLLFALHEFYLIKGKSQESCIMGSISLDQTYLQYVAIQGLFN